MINIEKYLYTPYVKGGRKPDAFDCWGLTLLIRQELGLPSLGDCPKADRDNPLAMQRLHRDVVGASLEVCETPAPGTIAAVFKAKVLVHVAVALEIDGRLAFIETNPKSGVRWLRPDRFMKTYYKVVLYRDRNLS